MLVFWCVTICSLVSEKHRLHLQCRKLHDVTSQKTTIHLHRRENLKSRIKFLTQSNTKNFTALQSCVFGMMLD